MMEFDTIYISKPNHVFLKVDAEQGIRQEISEYFTFRVPGAEFMQSYRLKVWDGLIRLYSFKKTLYVGLLDSLLSFAKSRGYQVVFSEGYTGPQNHFSEEFLDKFIDTMNLTVGSKDIKPKDYQIVAFKEAIKKERLLLLSPTSSGKSLIIYLLLRFYMEHVLDISTEKVIIIVPTTSLVEQLFTDFQDYSQKNGWVAERYCHLIYSGKEKTSKKPVTITTWQSIYKEPGKFLGDKVVIFGDEAHSFQAKSLTKIMECALAAQYRIGTTGTLQDAKTHQLVLQGLFGPVFEVTTTKKLMDNKDISELKINCVLLDYDDDKCKLLSTATYAQEYEFLTKYTKRTRFIAKLALNTKDNTLVLFKNIAHGKAIYDLITTKSGLRKIFFIYGKTEVEEREEIRRITEKEIGAIIVASYGTFSTGINIKNIYDVIFASPTKSRIRNLQSIGRGLRIGDRGSLVRLYDIADNLKWKSKLNFTLKHFIYRIKLYAEQEFNYVQYRIKI
jgi:Kyanoviridae DNA helicase